ncbi:MAG: MarR family transcriptional regulator [Sandaracinaceae bacterium]|nr:MarR family transcriptional regulator [Sandaracinaceae bacterium]
MAHDSHSVQSPAPRSRKGEVDRIVETILYLYAESRRVTKTEARERGLTGPQLSVLKILEATGDLSLTELSERMSAKNSTITGIVDRMERDGLVLRDRSSADRRVVLIRATDKGRELARSVKVGAMELLTGALAALDEKDRQELRRIVLELAEHVRSEVDKRDGARQSADEEGED